MEVWPSELTGGYLRRSKLLKNILMVVKDRHLGYLETAEVESFIDFICLFY